MKSQARAKKLRAGQTSLEKENLVLGGKLQQEVHQRENVLEAKGRVEEQLDGFKTMSYEA